MKKVEMLMAFEREINKLDDLVGKPLTEDSVYWINQAIAKFVKERFNGNAPHRTSYEQNEKRLRDLNNLYTIEVLQQVELSTNNPAYNEYLFHLPEKLMFMLNEDVIITDLSDNNKYTTSVFECTKDSFMYRITNSLTDFHYRHHKARPLRVVGDVEDKNYKIYLYTDKLYKIAEYKIGYLRYPEVYSLTDVSDATKEYTDFTDTVLYEIIKIAAQMYLENQRDERYKTITNEVLTQE